MAIPDEILELLERTGYEARSDWFYGDEHGEQWQFSSHGTARFVYFRTHAEVPGELYSIYVEEWRGGEGYEDEEFRGGRSEALAAIPRWAAWAREPFVRQPSTFARLLGGFRKRDPESQ